MERIQRAQAFAHGVAPGESTITTGILELNPRHPFVIKLLDAMPEDEQTLIPDSVEDSAWILLDVATMDGGFPIRDPKKYSQRMMRVLKGSLGVESLALADEIDPPEGEDNPEEPEFDMPDVDGTGDLGTSDAEDLDIKL